jgi:alanyl-tRNA synthetase
MKRSIAMTNKLYYLDSYIKSFTTKILGQHQDESGQWHVTLEETAFYPTGGGQPFDTGTLNDIPVINVEEVEGEIRHYVSTPLSEKDVTGIIDWDRRYDHMQQHAGQHILSAAFVELLGFETVSFHLGKETLTIDINTEELSEKMAKEVEDLANQVIIENRPIETKWVTEEESLNYPLRKKLSVIDNIRLVIIPEFDYNGCGGTHPNSTGEVNIIKILSWERQKKTIRVQFVCGNRVLKQLQNKHKVITEVGQLISSSEQEMTSAVKRLLEQTKGLEKALDEAKEKLLQFEARDLLMNFVSGNIVGEVFQNRSIQELQKLARILTTSDENIIALLLTENEDKIQMVFAKGRSVVGNMKNLIGEVLPLVNGKGGGNETMAQGGGEPHLVSGAKLLDLSIKKIETQKIGN